MARTLHKLNDTAIRAKNLKPKRYADGGGLYLNVSKVGNKSWLFLYKRNNARWPKEMGLGPYPDVSLSIARDLAQECRKQLNAGLDPIEEKRKGDAKTFGQAADALIESMSSSWRNDKHAAQWRMTLGDSYCKAIRQRQVAEVTTEDVLKVLQPVWTEKPETASRLRGRIERVLDYARARGWRSAPNPAIWRGHLKSLLPPPRTLVRGHHAALPYQDIPAFVVKLRAHKSLSARALEFLLLTASRTSEVREMAWDEVDFDGATWTVPADRMKMKRPHRVPLVPRSLEILLQLHDLKTGPYVFPGERRGGKRVEDKPLSQMAMSMLIRRMIEGGYTVHGLRSAFRDWCGDQTRFPRELAEMALAHKVGDETELAYRRSDALERRRKLMVAWADYCASSWKKRTASVDK